MSTPTLPFTRTPHLVELVAESERLATLLARIDVDDQVRETRFALAAVASLQLDGSPITAPPVDLPALPHDAVAPSDRPAPSTRPPDAVAPSDAPGRLVAGDAPVDAAAAAGAAASVDATASSGATTPVDKQRSTWLDALAVDREGDELLQTLEYLGSRTAHDAADLAPRMLTELGDVLGELHRRLTRGLLPPEAAGQLRTTDQAVHDASRGRVIYFAPDPTTVPDRLAHLAAWVASGGAREHALVVSGVVHLELLAVHPFEAANGRLARAAARLVLRARDLDPEGLAAPELALAADPIGYYDEVARTNRRRDLTIWLERWGEAVVDGLREVAREVGALDLDVPDRAAAFIGARPDPAFTIADYRAGVAVGPEDARADLRALLDAGMVRRVPASRGLRYRVTDSTSGPEL